LELVVISPRRLLTHGVERFSQFSRRSIDAVARKPSPPHPGTLLNILGDAWFPGSTGI
jgi:hypothetical protein